MRGNVILQLHSPLTLSLNGRWLLATLRPTDAWANLVQPQSFADNYTQAAAIGINAGMDQEVQGCSNQHSSLNSTTG